MNVAEFIKQFGEDAQEVGTEYRALLLLPTRGVLHDLFAQLIDRPDPFIVSPYRKDITHPTGAKLWVRDAEHEHDKFRLKQLVFHRVGYVSPIGAGVLDEVIPRVQGEKYGQAAVRLERF